MKIGKEGPIGVRCFYNISPTRLDLNDAEKEYCGFEELHKGIAGGGSHIKALSLTYAEMISRNPDDSIDRNHHIITGTSGSIAELRRGLLFNGYNENT